MTQHAHHDQVCGRSNPGRRDRAIKYSDPDRHDAEFAISLRAEWKRRKLKPLLLVRLVEVAERRGSGFLHVDASVFDETLLSAARKIGLAVELHSESDSPVHVSKRLRPD